MYRDTDALVRALAHLGPFAAASPPTELIVVGTSDDRASIDRVARERSDVRWVESRRGRAAQMNAGASRATGEWLLFLHADTQLPDEWWRAIDAADRQPGVALGCFRFALDSTSGASRVLERGVAWRVAAFKLPYGDQALFIRRSLFAQLGGYADLPIMEDVDLVWRARRFGHLYASPLEARTSARRWEEQGWVRRTAINFGLLILYAAGVSPAVLYRIDRARHL